METQPVPVAFEKPVNELIRKRFSCRDFAPRPIDPDRQRLLQNFAASLGNGPFHASARFQLLAANGDDPEGLRGLGTYGTIRSPAGFLAGVIGKAPLDLETYGYLLEEFVLYATSQDLGTCWLGGSFRRSGFARALAPAASEQIPAVAAVGEIGDEARARSGLERRMVRADSRLPWEMLFFDGRSGAPLSRVAAGPYAVPLDMVRLGPSAHNKQPWRILSDAAGWHFYLQRTPDITIKLASKVMGIADLQRMEMGIAMCHFAHSARELGLNGRWVLCEPQVERLPGQMAYTATWLPTP